jgi:hypothetical protein
MAAMSVNVMVAILLAASESGAPEKTIVFDDPDGAAGRVAAPVCVNVDLNRLADAPVRPELLRLVEVVDGKAAGGELLAVQFEPDDPGGTKGKLWWIAAPGAKGRRRYRLVTAEAAYPSKVFARTDARIRAVDVSEGALPVLRYNHGTVPVPPGIDPDYARGDYIHPVYGPDGEALTDDYSQNHPHHRGVSWAWPITRWKGESRDLWAVKILPGVSGAVWSRPVALRRVEAGPVWAAIEAENVWNWGDRDPIVREDVLIRAFRAAARRRFVDVEVRLTGLVDDVRIGGRPKASYGGFSMRTFPEFPERKIAMHIDPPGASPRRAWFHLTGRFPGGKGPAGVLMLESVSNPDYPNQPQSKEPGAKPGEYPPWRSVQPAYPGDREVPLPKGKTLVLRYRLWIHGGALEEKEIIDAWSAYALSRKEVIR